MIAPKLLDRVQDRARAWSVTIDEMRETESSVIAFGCHDNRPVVLKVIKNLGDEWRSGEILAAFDGKGFARVYEYIDGAVLLERLRPGTSLEQTAVNGKDEDATNILAGIIQQMSPRESPKACATIPDWAKGFERYLATRDDQIPRDLVEDAHQLYLDLGASQRRPKLLHGDLQHYNVLFDSKRGWLAIDPKGVIGEIEYEIGAVLRNPFERPELFAARSTIERRLNQFARRLNLDTGRALAWGFAQAVLSAIWSIEDGFAVNATNPPLRLANAIRPMLRTYGSVKIHKIGKKTTTSFS
ncbi:MAG TPA: aminoglycoside phosphotransferase family protein [Pyrinomonadaceae bacterium]|jgi:streptomycin 6-kinase